MAHGSRCVRGGDDAGEGGEEAVAGGATTRGGKLQLLHGDGGVGIHGDLGPEGGPGACGVERRAGHGGQHRKDGGQSGVAF